jgi:hypothetical protein
MTWGVGCSTKLSDSLTIHPTDELTVYLTEWPTDQLTLFTGAPIGLEFRLLKKKPPRYCLWSQIWFDSCNSIWIWSNMSIRGPTTEPATDSRVLCDRWSRVFRWVAVAPSSNGPSITARTLWCQTEPGHYPTRTALASEQAVNIQLQ